MRKRILVAAGAAAVLAAGGAMAFAEPDEPAPAGPPRADHRVQLPTGDTVTVSPRGGLTWHPAAGREDIGYATPSALDGSEDVVVIPLDRLDDLAEGVEDPRRYNVSELLRAGESDAAAADRLRNCRVTDRLLTPPG